MSHASVTNIHHCECASYDNFTRALVRRYFVDAAHRIKAEQLLALMRPPVPMIVKAEHSSRLWIGVACDGSWLCRKFETWWRAEGAHVLDALDTLVRLER